MYFSLNKKITYTIIAFFFIIISLFIYTFYVIYGNKFQEEQRSHILHNQQYAQLLNKNIIISRSLINIVKENPSIKLSDNTYQYIKTRHHQQTNYQAK